MESPRVLLVDDLPEILEKVSYLLRDDFDIVGYAQDGEGAIKAAATLNPDLLVLDIAMPLRNGIQVASHLRDSGYRAKVIFLTVHDDPDYVEAAWSVGGLGYVLKSRIATDLLPASASDAVDMRYVHPDQQDVLEIMARIQVARAERIQTVPATVSATSRQHQGIEARKM